MKHGHTIITLFAILSLGALSLWAVKDLWLVMLVLLAIVGAISMTGKKGKS